MNKEKDSYSQILKATSLFGGVQVINILVSIIRTKFVAVLLGASGVGMIGLFQNAMSLISSISGLGITSSAIRQISAAKANGNLKQLSETIYVFNKWLMATGVTGTLVAIIISPFLSTSSFGTDLYSWEFVALSFTIILTTLSAGQTTILRGLRQNSDMAKANTFGSIIGLVLTIPLYYLFGVNGIVPSLIISSIITLGFSTFYVKKIDLESVKLPFKIIIQNGKVMVKFGVLMTISSLIVSASSYIMNIFISSNGDLKQVGYYSAGIAITSKYVGLVFTAMAMDYYPRLSAIQHDNDKIRVNVNQQAEICILILTPILVLLILTMPLVVNVLYSKEFQIIIGFVRWLSLGIILKAVSWCMGFIVLAKGNSKLFFITELGGNAVNLALNIIFYNYWGLEGLGISFIVGYLIYLFMILMICNKYYAFHVEKTFLKIAVIGTILTLVTFLFSKYLEGNIVYYLGALLLFISLVFSIFNLNQKLQFIKY